jgi:exodeoxyribonuclease V alpha subunit
MTVRQEVSGRLSRIIFSNNETHFIIAAFDGPIGPFSTLGTLPNAQEGLEYVLTGEWQDNAKFGKQFKFDIYRTVEPTDAKGIFNYLVRICKFVGPAIGNQILDSFGEDALRIMKEEPERFSENIHGITIERALDIQAELIKHAEYEDVMIKLESLLNIPGMRKSLIPDLLTAYKHEAADRVLENPYMLVQFHGIGFALADKIAILSVEIPRDSLERKKAATIHAMKGVNQDGNVWIQKERLIEKVYELIQIKNLGEGLEALLEDETLIDIDGDIAFFNMAKDELAIAKMLISLERIAS